MKTDLLKAADNLWVAVKAYVVSRNSYPEWNALHEAIAEYGRTRRGVYYYPEPCENWKETTKEKNK